MRGLVAARAAVVALLVLGVSVSFDAANTARADADPPEDVSTPAPVADGPKTKDGQEITAWRTRHASTYVGPHGSFVTRVEAGSRNYLDASGKWKPVDGTIVEADATSLSNRANRYQVRLPKQLGTAPVRLDLGSDWVSFDLQQAARTRAVAEGASVSYDGVFPGVQLAYGAAPDAVKETIVLADSQARSSFSWQVRVSPGLQARANAAGGVDFVDNASGTTRFSFAPPWMRDSSKSSRGFSRAVRLEVTTTSAGYEVTMTADQSWLQQTGRVYPVVIDPTMTFGGTQRECTISRAAPTVSDCNVSDQLDVGYDGNDTKRALLKFDLSGIPANAIMLDANLGLYLRSASTSNAAPVGVHRLLADWDAGATWNTRNGSAAWATPGGEIFPEPAGAGPTTVAGAPGWYRWRITQMVQKEQNGEFGNFGFLLKQEGETTNNLLHFASTRDLSFLPELRLEWEYPIGLRRHYTYDTQQLTDRTDLNVNVTTGNAAINADDARLTGRGLNLELDRTFNSLGVWNTNGGGEFNWRWQMGTGVDIYMRFYDDGSAAYYGPSGYAVPFIRRSDGSYISPTALDSVLLKNTNGTYSLMSKGDEAKQNFSADGRLTSVEDANGNRITFNYSATTACCPGPWKLDSIVDTRGRTTQFAYNTSGLLTQITDSAGRLYKYAYDSSQNLSTYTDPSGKITRFTYSSGLITKVTDPRGNVTKIVYDLDGRVTSVKRLLTPTGTTGPTTSFTYNTKSLGFSEPHTIVTDANGNKTTFYYDAQSRVTKVVDALGRNVTADYTENSDYSSLSSGGSSVSSNTYDPSDNLISSSRATGSSSTWQYNDPSHPYYATRATDTQGNAMSYGYDSRGNLASVGSPTGANASTTYNPDGTIATATDFEGNVTSYSYDGQGNLMLIDPPGPVGNLSFTYDALSRVSTVTDGKSQTTTYGYDALDRVTSLRYQDGSTITYTYDGNGNLVTVADTTGTTTYTYDVLNRLTQETLPGPKTISYAYDSAGNLVSFTDAGGAVKYAYNAADRPTTVTEPNGKQTVFAYNTDGRRSETRYPNGVTMYFTYDGSARLTRVLSKKPASGVVIADFSYGYSTGSGQDTGLRQWMTDKDSNSWSYSYDTMNRLAAATKKSPAGATLESYAYSYDNNSNRTSQTVNGVSTNYTYNAADQLVTAGGTSFSYDANGGETGNSAGRSLAYNAKDQTASVTPAGGSAIAMNYADAGQFKRVSAGSNTFQNSELGLTVENATYYTRDPYGMLLEQRTGTNTHYFVLDGLGSVVAMTDASGNVAATFEYEPFGRVTRTTGTVSTPWRFLGGLGVYYDQATGLHKMGTRYYDSALGRFIQRDPLPGGAANAYDYAFQNPINNVDLDGLSCGPGSLGDKGWGDWVFTSACDFHDKCYGRYRVHKSYCDNTFYSLMKEACRDNYGTFNPKRYACYGAARSYYEIVSSPGGDAWFYKGQFEKCRARGHSRKYCAAIAAYYTAR